MMFTVPGESASASLELNWSRLQEITTHVVMETVEHSRDSARAYDEVVRYTQLLNALRHDRNLGGVRYLGMYRAPASKNRHHNVEGGLVKHLLQMWELWLDFRSILRGHHVQQHPELNDSNIWKCILHHDLNKVWKYRLMEQDEKGRNNAGWAVDYSDEPLSPLLGADVNKVIFLLNQQGITLSVPLFNALITAEGGFSQSPRPKVESVLAKVAYLLDDMSANVIDRLQTNRFWDSKEGGISEVP